MSGLSRGVINNRVNTIKRFFKWGVGEEHIPPSVYEGLRTVTEHKTQYCVMTKVVPLGPKAQQVVTGKQNRTIMAVLSPTIQLPVELKRHFVIIEHEPPDRMQLAEIARYRHRG